MDAGISTEENLSLIKENGYNYLCVSRKKLTKYIFEGDAEHITVYDNCKRAITLTRVEREETDGDYYLKVDSPSNALTEQSMNRVFRQRFEEELDKIKVSIEKKGCTKRHEKVWERIGKAKNQYPSIARFYDITVEHDDNGIATEMSWVVKESLAELEFGSYFLRTNVLTMNEKTAWDYYNLMRDIETTNRQLKTDLNLRPIYHQKDENSDAHIFFGLLAYWIVNTIRYQLKLGGETMYWKEIVRIMSTQKAVTSRAVNALGEEVEFRLCTVPTKRAAHIYTILGYNPTPFRKIKIERKSDPPDPNLKPPN